jgi:hypothetical protein
MKMSEIKPGESYAWRRRAHSPTYRVVVTAINAPGRVYKYSYQGTTVPWSGVQIDGDLVVRTREIVSTWSDHLTAEARREDAARKQAALHTEAARERRADLERLILLTDKVNVAHRMPPLANQITFTPKQLADLIQSVIDNVRERKS